MITKMAGSPKWRKILYNDQGVPDNYVDRSFLEELKKNLYTRTYSYQTLVLESGVITQQLSSAHPVTTFQGVCIFVVSFMYMEEKWLSPQLLVLVTSLVTLMLYFVNMALSKGSHYEILSHRTCVNNVKTAVLYLGVSLMLSSVLVSLTETISTDTIYAMTAVMLLANLLCHDYTAAPNRVPGALSLSGAMFASVCLASRLHSSWHAFAAVTFSFQLFALWPILRCQLQIFFSTRGQIALTASITMVTCCTLASVTVVGAVLYSITFVFITFICPGWLISLYPYKNNIYGPWDEAEIIEEAQPQPTLPSSS